MATVILARHGRSTANAEGTLAGRSKGVHLDDTGLGQARAIAERVAALPLAALVSSPLERCRETAREIARGRPDGLKVVTDRALLECDYGSWTGRPLKELAKQSLWKTVQAHPSAAQFPDGESMAHMMARGVEAVRRWDALVEKEHGVDAVWVAVSHGDVIKSVLADALGMHLDSFQRIVVDPASVSIIRYTPLRPFVVATNSTGGDLGYLRPPKKRRRRASSDAPVGGGAGHGGSAASAHGATT